LAKPVIQKSPHHRGEEAGRKKSKFSRGKRVDFDKRGGFQLEKLQSLCQSQSWASGFVVEKKSTKKPSVVGPPLGTTTKLSKTGATKIVTKKR